MLSVIYLKVVCSECGTGLTARHSIDDSTLKVDLCPTCKQSQDNELDHTTKQVVPIVNTNNEVLL